MPIPVNNEHYDLEFFHRKENSSYEFEDAPFCVCKGRPANQFETKTFRVLKGVNGNDESLFVFSTNLPTTEIKPKDRVKFMGKFWSVQSVGYYLDAARLINPSCLSEEQIVERCPKGLNLQ